MNYDNANKVVDLASKVLDLAMKAEAHTFALIGLGAALHVHGHPQIGEDLVAAGLLAFKTGSRGQ